MLTPQRSHLKRPISNKLTKYLSLEQQSCFMNEWIISKYEWKVTWLDLRQDDVRGTLILKKYKRPPPPQKKKINLILIRIIHTLFNNIPCHIKLWYCTLSSLCNYLSENYIHVCIVEKEKYMMTCFQKALQQESLSLRNFLS